MSPYAALPDPSPWHALDEHQVAERLDSRPEGLSEAEAQARLTQFGPNELPADPGPGTLALVLRQFRNPLVIALLAAAGITLVLGEYADAVVILAVLVANAIIGFVQERQAERSVQSLLELIHPHALVVRGHEEHEVESRAVTPGDVVVLQAGGRVPADMRLVHTSGLLIDESTLTGEAVPVSKHPGCLEAAVDLADRTNMAYAGTMVASGSGRGYAIATGRQTEIGTIAGAVRAVHRIATPLQEQLDRLVRLAGLLVGLLSLTAFLIGIVTGHSASEMFLVAVTLAVSAIPEGLPIAFTIALAVGVHRMAQRKAIVRHLPSVETLGSATVIGADKTGTLTENRMTVRSIWSGGEAIDLHERGDGGAEHLARPAGGADAETNPHSWTLLTGVLTNEATATLMDDGVRSTGDPTEAALLIAAMRFGIDLDKVRESFFVLADVPFDADRQFSASLGVMKGRHLLFLKGAPERVIAMCDRMLLPNGAIAPIDHRAIERALGAMTDAGLRVLAMAYGQLPGGSAEVALPANPSDLIFAGLQGMTDPPRAGVHEAVQTCTDAGLRILMITGDHASTAGAIGRELEIVRENAPILTGRELNDLTDEALDRETARVSIFARVEPAQKLRIVQSLQRQGEVVAITGDGVNDAPALRAADVGIAMGKRGTDVAKEASDMVLTDDNFVTIAAAIQEGRGTIANVRRIVFFLFSANAAEVATVLATLALGWPLPLTAVQILWLNLVTDSLPVMALAFEPGEQGAMREPPRGRRDPILSRLLWERLVISSLVMTIGTLALYRHELDASGSETAARTVALTSLVVFQMVQAINASSLSESLLRRNPFRNRHLMLAIAASLAIHAAALIAEPTQRLLGVEPLDPASWMLIALTAATLVLAVELHKLLRRNH